MYIYIKPIDGMGYALFSDKTMADAFEHCHSLVAWHLWTVACLPGRAGAHATAAVVRVKRGEPAQRWGFLRKTRYLPSGNLTIFNIAIENGYL